MLDEARPTGAAVATDRHAGAASRGHPDATPDGPSGSAGEASIGRVLGLAADLAGTPIAAISLACGTRHWSKGVHAIAELAADAGWTPQADGSVVVHDTCTAPGASGCGEGGIRFHASVPLVSRGGRALGRLCVADREPRASFPSRSLAQLRRVARIAADVVEAARDAAPTPTPSASSARRSRRC